MQSVAKQFREGIITQNPTLILLLGMCSTLAITTSVANGVGMGLAVTFVLIGSNVVISLVRKLIPSKIRIASFVVIISAFVTTIDLLMQAYVPALSQSLGIFIPLIVVNCIILARAEAFAFKNGPLASAIDGLAMGIGYTLALIIMCVIREILGSGTLLGHSLFGSGFQPVLMFILPSGGFLTLGCIIAAMQKILSMRKDGGK